MMLGSKDPNYDACGLFRALIPLLCSYRGGPQGLSPTYEQAHVGLDLLTLASFLYYHILARHTRKIDTFSTILNHSFIPKKDMKEYHTTEKYDKVKMI